MELHIRDVPETYSSDVTAFPLTGPEGHVLMGGGHPGTAPMILESTAGLGFDIRDVKVLLNSHARFDQEGGLATLQEASGAELWVSEHAPELSNRRGQPHS